jgi:hypothetical protein
MLSVFPELFNYSQIAPFILRISLAVILVRFGYLAIFKTITRHEKTIGIIQWLAAIFLFLGFLTQIAAILAIAAVFNIKPKTQKLMVIAVAVSLILLGPGLFSFDLPL